MADEATRAYVAGLKMLSRRELSEAQVRQRLARKQFEEDDINAALERLRRQRAVDARRAALACPRSEVRQKNRGRARVLRQVEGLGIATPVARAAVAEVFEELDERALLEQALERRLRRGPLTDAASARRVHRYLLAQGFDPSQVMTAIRGRVKHIRVSNDD
jgi:regulatory protein